MLRLSSRQAEAIAVRICGDVSRDGVDPLFAYRTGNDIERFIQYTGATPGEFSGSSRNKHALSFVDACQLAGSPSGNSGLTENIEKVLATLLDSGEFESPEDHRTAVDEVNDILGTLPVRIAIHHDQSVAVVSTGVSAQQQVLDEQIHTVFGNMLKNSDLGAARTHYAKAQRFLRGSSPDFENAAKEAVASLESLVLTLTGERDFTGAIKKATKAGYIPKPLDDIAIKLFAFRGNEPGVAHGHAKIPNVHPEEAQLVVNLVGSIAAYLAVRLRQPSSA